MQSLDNAKSNKAKIFVSHSSVDKPFVRKLVEELKSYDLPIWFDEQEIDVGDSIVDKVNQGLQNASYVIVVYSKSSVDSPWVRSEVNATFVREMACEGKLILPVVIDDCDLPPLLKDRLWADFRGDFSMGLLSILRVFKQEKAPSVPKAMHSGSSNCISSLESLSLADVRHMMNQLRRAEVSAVWFDTLDSRMDDDLPRHEKIECIVELLCRAKEQGKLLGVFRSLCRNHRDLNDRWFRENA